MQTSPDLSPMIGIRGSEGEAVWWRQVKGPCLPAALSHPLHVLNLIKTMLTWPLNSPLLISIGKSFCIICFSKQTIFSCISKIKIMPLAISITLHYTGVVVKTLIEHLTVHLCIANHPRSEAPLVCWSRASHISVIYSNDSSDYINTLNANGITHSSILTLQHSCTSQRKPAQPL